MYDLRSSSQASTSQGYAVTTASQITLPTATTTIAGPNVYSPRFSVAGASPALRLPAPVLMQGTPLTVVTRPMTTTPAPRTTVADSLGPSYVRTPLTGSTQRPWSTRAVGDTNHRGNPMGPGLDGMSDTARCIHRAQQQYEQLQLQRQQLQHQAQQEQQLQELMQKIQQEQQQIYQLRSVSTTTVQGSIPTLQPTLQTLAGLRQDLNLNRQADAILYGNTMTAAMVNHPQGPAPGPNTQQAYIPSAPIVHAQPQGYNCVNSVVEPYMPTQPLPTPTQSQTKDKTLCPEQYAHRPGMVDPKFEQLQLTEFVEGYINIILQGNMKPEEPKARLEKLAEIMGMAGIYQWPRVRALIGVMLKEIHNGQRTWITSLSNLKDRMLMPSDLIHTVSTSINKESTKSVPRKQFNQNLMCKDFNWGECAQGKNCPSLHACEPCLRLRKCVEEHTAKKCPHDPRNKK